MKRWTTWMVWALLAGSLACGDDESRRPDYRVEGAGASEPVQSMSDEQLEQICVSYDAYLDTWVSFDAIAYAACLPQALLLGSSRADCEQRLSACEALFPEPIAISGQAQDSQVCVDNLRNCQATVSNLEGCVNLNLDRFFEVTAWSCDLLGDPDTASAARQYQDTVEICADLDAACNDFAAPVIE